jgi:hypothetical protein
MAQRDYFEKDYYATLGVDKDASQADISKAYRRLARELHPDARPNDPEAETKFKEVSEAHSVLSNPEKRKEYDQVREMVSSGAFAGFPGAGGPGGGFGGFPGGAGGGQAFDIGDLLGDLFSGGAVCWPACPAARSGRDVETDLTLSFADAMAGVTTTLRVAGGTMTRAIGEELDRTGLGLRLKYLSAGMSDSARAIDERHVVPERAGYYLGARMVEPAIASRGFPWAIRANAAELGEFSHSAIASA